jgi:dTDP-4-amino-4,6-dideoxygalactose transaminase
VDLENSNVWQRPDVPAIRTGMENRMINFLDLKKQYQSIKTEVDQAMASVIADTAFVGGKYVKAFEAEFADYQQAAHCISCGNGTDALEIAIAGFGFAPGSEIIVPANTFVASAEAVENNGLKVVFSDCNEGDYTLNVEDAENRITSNTVAIMAVHLYGHPCDMDALVALGKKHNIKIIEDCAQAHGAEYKGRRIGAIGDVGCFSFYPGKNLGAYGDGGAITTQDEALAIQCRKIANHGRIAKYNHEFSGRNSRLDGLQAAILSVKLKHLDAWTDQRIAVADYYMENLGQISDLILPTRQNWAKQVYHLFVIRTTDRDGLKAYLGENNIGCGVHYPIALPKLPAFTHCGQADEDFFANRVDQYLLSLPMGEHLSVEAAGQVVKALADR